jgi:hypothetical protein
MSRVAVVLGAVMLIACAPSAEQAGEAADTTAAVPAALSAADLAGTWTVETMPLGADSVLVTSHLVANSTTDGWMLHIPGRDSIPVRVAMDADSVIMDMGPFPSVLREGVMVSTRNVARLQNGMLTGMMSATYAGGAADSVVTFRSRGTRN